MVSSQHVRDKCHDEPQHDCRAKERHKRRHALPESCGKIRVQKFQSVSLRKIPRALQRGGGAMAQILALPFDAPPMRRRTTL